MCLVMSFCGAHDASPDTLFCPTRRHIIFTRRVAHAPTPRTTSVQEVEIALRGMTADPLAA